MAQHQLDTANTEISLAPDDLRPRLIMIIDDEPINCKVARKYLQQAGYTNFVILNDAVKAMSAIHEHKPDLILLDIMMPEVSGLDILRRVRDDADLSQTPVLILKATCDEQTKRQALEWGATDFCPSRLT